MSKKREVPQHLRKLKGTHPRSDLRLIHVLENMDDPRGASCNFKHPLITILFITIVCSLCGADNCELIVLNAWSHDNGVCIGHVKVEDKSNEITALPKLMEVLDLKGTIVTADALNTQKEIATQANLSGADYILPVKGNHPTLQEDLQLLFKDAQENEFRGFDADEYRTIEKAHGRVEERKYYSIDASELPSAKEWTGLRCAGMVTRERTIRGKTSIEVQYYISSCDIDAQLLEKVVRGHWGIETSLHWVLDVVFREDKLRYRERVGAQNLAAIRKLTLGALTKDTTLKCGKAGKRLVAATNPQYREAILNKLF